MIHLTRIDGEAFVLNAELICSVETRGDTFLTLAGGQRLAVRETVDEVVRRAVAYQRSKNCSSPHPCESLPLASGLAPARA